MIEEFLSHIRDLGMELWIENDQLYYKAPQGVLTPALRSELAARKKEILAFLQEAQPLFATVRPAITPVTRDRELPLSFAQQRLWIFNQLEPNNPVYNMVGIIRLVGTLHVAALEQSLNALVQRHEILRTRFVTIEDHPTQVIIPALTVPLPIVDLTDISTAIKEEEAQWLIDKEALAPFDLARGPLLRATLLRLEEGEHILLLTMHHIISDGWSLGIVAREFASFYNAFLADGACLFSGRAVQYADFAIWQRKWLQGEVANSQLAYWKQQLGSELTWLELPTDYSRPPIQTYNGASRTITLSKALSDALRSLSRQEGTTLFMTLLAAFKTLLYRYTGHTDVSVGSPIAGRNMAEIEEVIGFFVNTLVLRTDLSGEPGFRELLRRVREVTLGAYAHQDLPFEMLLEELRPERTFAQTPLFQAFFNMLNFPPSRLEMSGVQVTLIAPPEVGSKFDLTLYANDLDEAIQFTLTWNTDLFSQGRMVEMLEQFRFLLEQIVERPDAKISYYSLVTHPAKAILPDPTRPLDSMWIGAVHDLFSHLAQWSPDRLAVVDKQETWTAGELDARSNQLANYLHSIGIRSQDVVAIYGYRNATLIWAIMGVLKAGAAFLILDSAYPPQRLIDYLQIAGPRAWLQIKAAGPLADTLDEFVTLSYRHRLALAPREVVAAHDPLAKFSIEAPNGVISPDDVAYVVFTSGTTGTPKGVWGRHGPLSHFLAWQKNTFDFRDSDQYSMLSGLSHDPLFRDIFTPLTLGGTVHIPDPEQIGIPGYLAEWMRQEEITVTHLTPAMMRLLSVSDTGAPVQAVPSLRYAFTVGETLTKQDVHRLYELAPMVRCINFYGTAETQRALGCFVVPSDEGAISKEALPLGQGIQGVQLLVLNAVHHLAGVGELGEIYVRSQHLAKGYLGDETLTQERFILNPFTDKIGDRLYKTGDKGYYQADGNVEFYGRTDRQINVRGFRVELGEIEATLSRYSAVQEAVVVAHEDECSDSLTALGRNKRLVAYVVPTQGCTPTLDEMQSFLRSKLPDYMVPSIFMTLPALPLTPNGKIDYRALPVPDQSRPNLEEAFVPPRTPIEETIAGIVSQVLGIEQVGIHDDFFRLGGYSLAATQIVSRIRRAFEAEVPLRALFEVTTVAGLAKWIETAQRSERRPSGSPIVPAARREGKRLSFALQRLQASEQSESNELLPAIPAAIRLTGQLNSLALQKSLDKVISQYLRQGNGATLSVPLALVDLQECHRPEQESQLLQWVAEEVKRPFDSQSSGVRATLVRMAGEDHLLLLVRHHTLLEKWTMDALLRELAVFYHAAVKRQGRVDLDRLS